MKRYIITLFLLLIIGVSRAGYDRLSSYYYQFYQAEYTDSMGKKIDIIADHSMYLVGNDLSLMQMPFDPFIQLQTPVISDTCINIDLYPIEEIEDSKSHGKFLDSKFCTQLIKEQINNDSDPKVLNIQPESTIPLSNNCVNWIFHVKSSEKGFALKIEDILRVLHQRNSNFRYEIIIDGD